MKAAHHLTGSWGAGDTWILLGLVVVYLVMGLVLLGAQTRGRRQRAEQPVMADVASVVRFEECQAQVDAALTEVEQIIKEIEKALWEVVHDERGARDS